MSLTGRDAWNARFKLSGLIKLKMTREEEDQVEYLPRIAVRSSFPQLSDREWNDLVHLLSCSVELQPFGWPYLWQIQDRISFAKWLRSWKV